jgi:hypothetical protein
LSRTLEQGASRFLAEAAPADFTAGAIMKSVTALEQNHRSTDIKPAGTIMESVTALEQNHRSTDIKPAGAFENGRRDARPTLSIPTVW